MTIAVARIRVTGMREIPRELAFQWKSFAGRVRWMIDFRKHAGVSAASMAKKVGLPRQYITDLIKRLEKGNSITLEMLSPLRRAFDVSWDWLADGTGWPNGDIERALGRPESAPPVGQARPTTPQKRTSSSTSLKAQ